MRAPWKQFMSSAMGRQMGALLAYHLLQWPLQIALVSVATFFHLGMGHPLGVIEQWLFAQGPWIMMGCKLSSVLVVLMFLFQASPNRHPYRKVFADRPRPPGGEIALVICVALVLTLATGLPGRASVVAIQWGQVLTSLVGTVLFYAPDLFLLFALGQEFPISPQRRAFVQLSAALLLWGWGRVCFPFADGPHASVFFHFLTLLFLAFWKDESVARPACYLVLFLAPVAAFMGLDPMWGPQLSPFVATRPLGGSHAAILLFLAVGHAWAKERNLFRHRYLAGP